MSEGQSTGDPEVDALIAETEDPEQRAAIAAQYNRELTAIQPGIPTREPPAAAVEQTIEMIRALRGSGQ